MKEKLSRYVFLVGALVGLVGAGLVAFSGNAAAAEGEFYLQVSPSPLVVTLKPGETNSYDLKIRNAGSAPENLKIAPRSFTIDNASGEVKFDDTKIPPEIGDWTSFSAPEFTVQPGEWYTQKVTFSIPKEAGFSYSFALVITRQDAVASSNAGRELKGSVAVFSLVNIDKPGATRILELEKVSTSHSVYEFLPAKIDVQLKNAGNSIVRPAGNVFIQRSANDAEPISVLPVNENEGYILPGYTRTLAINWTDGYPSARIASDGSGQGRTELDWNLANLLKLRIGYYTAKVVAIYNDGQRDVPVAGEVGFLVIPWKILLVGLIIVSLIGAGIWSVASKLFRGSKRRGRKGTVKFRK